MSDRSFAGYCLSHRAGPFGVLAVLALGIGIWSGCGDEPSEPPGGAGSDSAGVTDKTGQAQKKATSEATASWVTEDFNLAAGGQLHLLVDDLESDGQVEFAARDR